MIEQALIVTDLGYGDSGKGCITDFLVRNRHAGLVVRYNGGAQAAHNVVLPDRTHHTFSQWGSGTFAGARTFLSRFMIVHPFALVREAEHLMSVGLRDPWGMLAIDERCSVITPYHQAMNRIREIARGKNRHGSCGIGIGETVQDQKHEWGLQVKDCLQPAVLLRKLEAIRESKLEIVNKMSLPDEANDDLLVIKNDQLNEKLAATIPAIFKRCFVVPEWIPFALHQPRDWRDFFDGTTVVFEGAQGVLIDEKYGFHPYTTWSNCTSQNALELLAGFRGRVEKIGVLRCYSTRHGPGPFVPYDAELTAALPDAHNGFHPWQREFRCGAFDIPATKYAITVNQGIDYLAITHLDRTQEMKNLPICTGYELDGEPYSLYPPLDPTVEKMEEIGEDLERAKPVLDNILGPINLVHNIEAALGHKIGLISFGPTHAEKRWEMPPLSRLL